MSHESTALIIPLCLIPNESTWMATKNMESLEIQSNNVEDYVEDTTALSSRKGKSQTLNHFWIAFQ